jgi:uncharacterized repeat protein (TIGR03803 family)
MNTCIKNLFLLPVLIGGLGVITAGRVTAQSFTTLHYFTGGSNDGANPKAGLILSGNTLYGTAQGGGPSGNGTVFAINTTGTGFTNLHSFTATPSFPFPSTNSDGVGPQAGLILSGNTLYGTAYGGGSSGNGTVFALNTNGAGFTNLNSFSGSPSDGANPYAGLILSGNAFYGTTWYGGISGVGTVFAVNTDGTGSTNLHSFTSGSDGAYPFAGLILSGNTLYGTTAGANSLGSGTVFAINTDGTGFTNLHSFISDSDGAYPYGGLILSSNTLYGTAYNGGSSGAGSVFAVNTDGTGFTNLHNFTALVSGTNSDGAYPRAGLILSGHTLYGTALAGGRSGNGTVFALNTDGTGFTTLHSFTFSSDGAGPQSVILSGNTLYGTTSYYSSSGYGTVFSLSLAPQLTMTRSGADVILTWPTHVAGFDYTGFTLQSTTDLSLPNSWSPVAQAAVTNAGQISTTVPTAIGRKFFRLGSQ